MCSTTFRNLMRAGANNLRREIWGAPAADTKRPLSSRRCNPLLGQGMPNLRRPWTGEDDARFPKLLEAGVSISVVAEKLKRTARGVKSRSPKLGVGRPKTRLRVECLHRI